MLFTKESDYAIRVVRALRRGERMTLKAICEEEQIPEAFGYKITKKLSQAGIIEITRGAMGGYALKKALTELTLYDVVTAIEPDFAVLGCVHQFCERNGSEDRCKVHRRIVGIQQKMEVLLKEETLSQILE